MQPTTSARAAFGASMPRARRVPAPATSVGPVPKPEPTPVPKPEPASVSDGQVADAHAQLEADGAPGPADVILGKFEGWAAELAAALEPLPPSVIRDLEDRLERKKYDRGANDPAIREIVAKAVASYLRKKEKGRATSAARRAKAKDEKAAGLLRPDNVAEPNPGELAE